MSVSERSLNQIFVGVRGRVEQALAGVKRGRMVKDVLRLTKTGSSDQVMALACGLHNLRITYRHPVPTLNLLSLCLPA